MNTEWNTEWVDGFLLGDGHIEMSSSKKGRASCGQEHKEFSHYLMNGFGELNAGVMKIAESSMKTGFKYHGRTYFDERLYYHRQRWYSTASEKQPPDDVIISPTSVMLWYLGDGSQTSTGENMGSLQVRLSTDGFSSERVAYLVDRLKDNLIQCHRNNENRIQIDAKGVPAFFNFIGRESPVKCYEYKFDLPDWRFEARRMRDVSDELQVDYQRLAYLVKIGKLPVFRLTEKGKPRFLQKHIEAAREAMTAGLLF